MDTAGGWGLGGIFTGTGGDTGKHTYLSRNGWVSQMQLGDYGYFSLDSRHFRRQGNLFADIKSLNPEADTIPRQQKMTAGRGSFSAVVGDRGMSLPSNHNFNLWLASLSPRLVNAYLVTRIVQYPQGKCRAHTLYLVTDGWISLGTK